MEWKFEKFKGDMGIYAFCPKCNFHCDAKGYDFVTNTYEVNFIFRYCPICGEHLRHKGSEVIVTWNERGIDALYLEEICKEFLI